MWMPPPCGRLQPQLSAHPLAAATPYDWRPETGPEPASWMPHPEAHPPITLAVAVTAPDVLLHPPMRPMHAGCFWLLLPSFPCAMCMHAAQLSCHGILGSRGISPDMGADNEIL